MPNSNYIKGRKKEYLIVNKEKEKGCIAFRSAGSHSPVDVVSIDVEKKVIKLIQSKPESMNETKRQKLRDENIKLNGVFLVKFSVI